MNVLCLLLSFFLSKQNNDHNNNSVSFYDKHVPKGHQCYCYFSSLVVYFCVGLYRHPFAILMDCLTAFILLY